MYARFFHTTDVIIEKGRKIVIVVRAKEPFKGMLEWVGGHVEENETVEECAIREVKEETGLNVKLKGILGVYSEPSRDPRGPTITTAFVAKTISGKLRPATDAKEAKLVYAEEINPKKLAFDHRKILSDYIKWKKKKGTYWSTK
jgi:ADP-ribose pyrophosphatase YjhB (NUDIX family)